jgi:hypothetical protein
MFKHLLGCFGTLWHNIANECTVILLTAITYRPASTRKARCQIQEASGISW